MHACFQTGCHDSIGLNPAWEDSGFVLSRQEGGLQARACWELRARCSGFVAQRLPTDLLRVVIICLLHPIKHASVQTINSKEDIDELSSTRSRIGARMRDVLGQGCRFLDTLSKSRRPSLATGALQTRFCPDNW
jgi:hypothetical protein